MDFGDGYRFDPNHELNDGPDDVFHENGRRGRGSSYEDDLEPLIRGGSDSDVSGIFSMASGSPRSSSRAWSYGSSYGSGMHDPLLSPYSMPAGSPLGLRRSTRSSAGSSRARSPVRYPSYASDYDPNMAMAQPPPAYDDVFQYDFPAPPRYQSPPHFYRSPPRYNEIAAHCARYNDGTGIRHQSYQKKAPKRHPKYRPSRLPTI